MQWTRVRRAVSAVVIDSWDDDRKPELIKVNGVVTFTPSVNKGDVVQWAGPNGPESLVLAPIQCRISDGIIMHRGGEGVYLAAGGEGCEPSIVRWKATFSNMQADGWSFSLRPIVFDAVPDGEVDLTMVAPVANTPDPIVRGPAGVGLESIIVDGAELVFRVRSDAGSYEMARIPLEDVVRAEADAAAKSAANSVRIEFTTAATSAKDSATVAAASAKTATTKASEATTQATNAKTSATQAQSSADSASKSAATATQQATTATGQADKASAAANTAAAQAGKAAESAATATTQAASATKSASEAKQSATTATTQSKAATEAATTAQGAANTATGAASTATAQAGAAADSAAKAKASAGQADKASAAANTAAAQAGKANTEAGKSANAAETSAGQAQTAATQATDMRGQVEQHMSTAASLSARLASSPYNSITVRSESEAQALSGLRKGDYVHVLDTGNIYIWE